MSTSTTRNPLHPTMRYPAQHPRAGLALEAVGIVGGRPVWPMMGGAPDDGTGDDGGKGGDDGGKADDKNDDGKGDDGGKPDGRTFGQSDVERIVTQRLAEAKRTHERELERVREDAGKSDTARLEAERDRAVESSKTATTKAADKVAKALAQVAAITAGGRADRAAAIVRVADLDGVAKFEGDEFTVDETRLGEAIGKVLDEYPEWKGDAGKADDKGDDGKGDDGKGRRHPDSSGGDLGGGKGDGTTLDEFRDMDMAERSTLAADDPETYRRLSDAEIAGKRKHRR